MSELTYIAHHGIKGQKWGVRKYQNSDGSLTALGRAHYGVGEARAKVSNAVKSVGNAIRKKVAPTNAELNAQIRKQRSKNLNKQKREELKNLKKGIDEDAASPSTKVLRGQHKRFSEMSDQDIQARIKRLKSEIELADLERTKSMGPGMRMVDAALREAGKEALKNVASSYLTKAGNQAVDKMLGAAKEVKKQQDAENRRKEFESQLAEKKARQELEEWDRKHPTGLKKLTPSARKAAAEQKAEAAQKKADEKLKADAERSRNEQTVYKEREIRAKAYKKSGDSDEQIAKKLGISVSDVAYYLYEKPSKDKK